MIKVQKCSICNRNGYKIFDIKYNSKIIYSFFTKYYKDKNKEIAKYKFKFKVSIENGISNFSKWFFNER